jgi:hypothetical protein
MPVSFFTGYGLTGAAIFQNNSKFLAAIAEHRAGAAEEYGLYGGSQVTRQLSSA